MQDLNQGVSVQVHVKRACKIFNATPTFMTTPTNQCELLTTWIEIYLDSVCQSDQEALKSCF